MTDPTFIQPTASPALSTPVQTPVDNIPAPVFNPEPELTLDQKVDYLYGLALKLETLVGSINPEQIEQAQRIANNPLVRKLMGG